MNNKKGSTPIERENPKQNGESVPLQTPRKFSNKRCILIIAIVLAILIVGGAITAAAVNHNLNNNAEHVMSLAERYLLEENYEQAVIKFERAIKIDPMNDDAYIGLAEAYLELDDEESAVDVLEESYEETNSERVVKFAQKHNLKVPGLPDEGVSPGGAVSSSTGETPSEKPPVVWGQPEEPEKIPLTDEEYHGLNFGPITIDFFTGYAKANQKYDLTDSIDTIGKLDFVISKLTVVAEEDEADDSEFFEGDFRDFTVYYYKPETLEKLIRKYFLPSFKIRSIDYTESMYWNKEKDQFVAEDDFDVFEGISKEYYYIHESGYKAGDYYYLICVPLADYSKGEEVYYDRNLSNFTSDFFDIPRVKLKFKKFYLGEYYGEPSYDYVCVGCEPVREKSEQLKAAEGLFSAFDRAKEEMGGFQGAMYYEWDMGVITGNLGKRMYIHYFCQYGSRNFTQGDAFVTLGTKGKDDVITYESIGNTTSYGLDDPDPEKWYTVSTGRVSFKDCLKGETYEYKSVNSPEENTESHTLNDRKISKSKFENADIYTYFSELNKDSYVAKYEKKFEELTLEDLYEISRLIIS